MELFIILSFINTHTFYLVITYLELPLPTHGAMIIGLQERSPLHMLSYFTHDHPMKSAYGHA